MQDRKCAHDPCTCIVESGDEYCSPACREDATSDIRAAGPQCRCHHVSCEAR